MEEGGYSEQLAAARLAERNRQRQADRSNPPDQSKPADLIPDCAVCGEPMVLRTAKNGRNAGRQFWGCSAFPDCKAVIAL